MRNRLFAYVLLWCSLAACTTGIRFNPQESIAGYDAFRETEIRIFFDAGIYPYINVSIQGIEVPLHIDIGDGVSNLTLKPGILERITAAPLKADYLYADARGVLHSGRCFTVDGLVTGSIKLNNVICAEDHAQLPVYLMDIGRIGFNFLGEFNFLIDYREAKLVLYKQGTLPPYLERDWQRIELDRWPPLSFKARFANFPRELRFGIDTGGVMLKENLVENWIRIPLDAAFIGKQKEIEYVDGNSEFKIIKNIDIAAGGVKIRSLDFFLGLSPQPANIDGFLGGDFFFKHAVFFDNEGNVLYFRPYSKK